MKIEYIIPQSLPKEDRFLLAKAVDQYGLSQKRNIDTNTSFLDEREFLLVVNFLDKRKIKYQIVNMHPSCSKKIISFGNGHIPFLCYSFNNRDKRVKHSDILGSLFALGLDRESIGDIFVEEDICYFTILKKVSLFIDKDLKKIGSIPIKFEIVDNMILKGVHEEVTTVSISSLRLDSILSKIIPCSRTQAVDYLSDKKILVNYQISTNKNLQLIQGDILSIRFVGKFRIGKMVGTSKKGKIILEIIQYQ